MTLSNFYHSCKTECSLSCHEGQKKSTCVWVFHKKFQNKSQTTGFCNFFFWPLEMFASYKLSLSYISNCVDLSCFCTVESIRNQRRSARSGNLQLFGTFLSDNQVLIWKFNRLDRNRDKLLVSSEFLTSTMKKILGNVKRGRKCGKKLLVDCDLDKDRGLSMMEWTLCLRIHDRRMPLQ